MSSPEQSLRFWFVWFGLPSGEKGHVKRVFTKTLAKLAIFFKKTVFYCICLDGWERGIQTICFFIIWVDWVPVTECTYTLFEVMSGNEYWKDGNKL